MDRKRVLLLVAGLLAGTILSVLLYKVLDIPFLKQIIPIVVLIIAAFIIIRALHKGEMRVGGACSHGMYRGNSSKFIYHVEADTQR